MHLEIERLASAADAKLEGSLRALAFKLQVQMVDLKYGIGYRDKLID